MKKKKGGSLDIRGQYMNDRDWRSFFLGVKVVLCNRIED
jgi:hypothetical protein